MSLARRIEEYLKRILSQQEAVEIQRNELADFFQCVPSQINYVLSTRFTPAQGYLVESRRGGGGYVRIVKISWEDLPHHVLKNVYEVIDTEPGLNQWGAEGVLKRFYEESLITKREFKLLKAIISRETLAIDLPGRDMIRGRIIQAVLTTLCRKDY
jgi:transcriptional regulator CtsR